MNLMLIHVWNQYEHGWVLDRDSRYCTSFHSSLSTRAYDVIGCVDVKKKLEILVQPTQPVFVNSFVSRAPKPFAASNSTTK